MERRIDNLERKLTGVENELTNIKLNLIGLHNAVNDLIQLINFILINRSKSTINLKTILKTSKIKIRLKTSKLKIKLVLMVNK